MTTDTRYYKDYLERLYRPVPSDGDAITAEVWNNSHGAHEARLDVVARSDGPGGVLQGLRVSMTNDRRRLVVSPGMAIDGNGHWLVLPEDSIHQYSEDMGSPARIWLAESPVGLSLNRIPRATVMVSVKKPAPQALELARLPEPHAWPCPVDDSCRVVLDLGRRPVVRVTVGHVGTAASRPTLRGVNRLADWLYWRLGLNLLVEHINLDANLAASSDPDPDVDKMAALSAVPDADDFGAPPHMVYLVAHAQPADLTRLHDLIAAYLDDTRVAGTVFVEAARGVELSPLLQTLTGGETDALEPIETGNALGQTPNWFASWPTGAASDGGGRGSVRMLRRAPGDPRRLHSPTAISRLIVSNNRYGWLWDGELDFGKTPTREQVREAREFGENLVALVLRGQMV